MGVLLSASLSLLFIIVNNDKIIMMISLNRIEGAYFIEAATCSQVGVRSELRTTSPSHCLGVSPSLSYRAFHGSGFPNSMQCDAIKAIQRRQNPKISSRDKKIIFFYSTHNTPSDAVDNAQHLYRHQITLYPSNNIVTRSIFHALSIGVHGIPIDCMCSDVSSVIST